MVEANKQKQKPTEKPKVFFSEDEVLNYLRSDAMEKASKATVILSTTEGQSDTLKFTRHTNADGTKGGFIGDGVNAAASAYIDHTAVIFGDVSISNSRIGANSSIFAPYGGDFLSSSPENAHAQIVDSTIGASVKLKTDGLMSAILVNNSKIEDGVKMEMGQGTVYIVRSTIKKDVLVVTDDLKPPKQKAPDPDDMDYLNELIFSGMSGSDIKILDVDDSEIGSGSKVFLQGADRRLRIIDTKIPDRSSVTVDQDNHYLKVQLDHVLTNIFYSVNVPYPDKDMVLSQFIREAEDYAKHHRVPKAIREGLYGSLDPTVAKQLGKVLMKAKYVYEHIKYDDATKGYTKDKTDIPIDYFIEQGKGICFEHALLLYAILEKEAIDAGQNASIKPHFATGLAKSDDVTSWHAWTEIEINGQIFVVDPTASFLFSGKRSKSGKLTKAGQQQGGWDYLRDGMPKVTPLTTS